MVYRQQLLGFNAVRLPFSFDIFDDSPKTETYDCTMASPCLSRWASKLVMSIPAILCLLLLSDLTFSWSCPKARPPTLI